jgi:hypothetical protein
VSCMTRLCLRRSAWECLTPAWRRWAVGIRIIVLFALVSRGRKFEQHCRSTACLLAGVQWNPACRA